MVHHCEYNPSRTLDSGSAWVLENSGQSVVFTPCTLSHDGYHLCDITDSSRPKTAVSIVICTYGRPESLNETLHSLSAQTFKDFEVILLTERGNLSVLRDKGLKFSHSDIVSFIDDDVCCEPTWLQAVVEAFKEKGVVGVSGPTIIEESYQKNRDCFKFKRLRKLQEWAFKVPSNPGHLSPCGAPSMASNFESDYEGQVDYLECCNMSVKRSIAVNAWGFDSVYYKTSEWCEVDLSLKLGQLGKLVFRQGCKLYHRPSQAGIYKARIQTKHRWDNFITFQKRWVRPSLRRNIYWAFIWLYLRMKELRMI